MQMERKQQMNRAEAARARLSAREHLFQLNPSLRLFHFVVAPNSSDLTVFYYFRVRLMNGTIFFLSRVVAGMSLGML